MILNAKKQFKKTLSLYTAPPLGVKYVYEKIFLARSDKPLSLFKNKQNIVLFFYGSY